MGHIILLAVPCIVYPTLVAGLVAMMSRPRPARLLLGFLVGGMTISVSIGVAIVGSLRGSGAAPGPKPATKPVVDIAVGTLGWIRGHAREIVIWLAATVGVWLVVKGIVAAV